MKIPLLLAALSVAPVTFAQSVTNPQASVVDVPARQTLLANTKDPLLRKAIKDLSSCVHETFIPAPTGRMAIPHHYLTGSNGPTNPAEHAATRVYEAFEDRINAGMNRFLATGSHAESACALDQLDAWAKAGALLNYDAKESSQSWYQVEWTLSAAGITDSVLVNDTTLDPAEQKRVTQWLDAASRRDISFERPGDSGNNHHYWRALNAIAIGITANDDALFQFGLKTYKQAIDEIDERGAFPKEMARHENAIHYQGFALEPLVLIAEYAERQGVDLYAFASHDRTLTNAITFFGNAVTDPALVRPYTNDEQKTGFGAGDFAPYNFYIARFGPAGLPASITTGVQKPTKNNRLGGSTTIMATK